MKTKTNLTFLTFLLLTFLSYSQSGKITGTLMDGEYDEPMAFASVIVKGTTQGVSSDFDGNYEIELNEGTYTMTYSYVGYQSVEIEDVIVKSNQITNVDVTLSTNSLETVVITTTLRKNTESAVLDLQKKSAVMLDGLSSQSIKKSGASNIASAVKSVPGVSVQGGKYVYVRGLGDRYTKSILNGMDIPGLDPNRNTIQMDIFPTNILDNIIVIKSASAEYPADFTGGVIDIVTKDFPSKKTNSFSIGHAYNPTMHNNSNYLTSKKSKTDIFGFDNGYRNLPINRYQPIPGTFDNSPSLTTLTSAFNPQLSAQRRTSNSDFSFGFTSGNQFEVGNNRLGYQLSMSYKNTTTFFKDRIDNNLIKNENDSSVNELEAKRISVGDEGINNVLLNGLLGVVYKRDRSKYKLTLLHIQNGESTAGYYYQQVAQGGGGSGFVDVFKDAILYTQRSVSNALIVGTHTRDDGWKTEWKISPTISIVKDLDHKITPFMRTDEGSYGIRPSSSGYPVRIWRDLMEINISSKLSFLKKYTLFDEPAKLKFGGAFTYKTRDFEIDNFSFTSTTQNVENGIADNLLLTENLWTTSNQSGTHMVFGDSFKPANSFEGEQRNLAVYASNEFNISEKLKSIIGLRAENFKSFYTGQNQSGSEIFNNTKIIDKLDIFPSANFIYAVNDNTNFRTSYSISTARPSFKEASRAQIFDAITGRMFIGNLDLRPSYINNFDLRYEIFGDKEEIIAFSSFYKDFKDPIELSFFASAPNQLTPRNLGSANVYGFEFEFRKPLTFLSNEQEKLKFTVNASYIKSSLKMYEDEYNRRVLAARDGEIISKTRDLQGQSPFLINSSFNYKNTDLGVEAGIYYNVQGKTLEVVGTGIVPDVYSSPFHNLNLNLNKTVGKDNNTSIDLKIKNLLNNKKESVYESFNTADQLYSLREYGTEISIGYSLKF